MRWLREGIELEVWREEGLIGKEWVAQGPEEEWNNCTRDGQKAKTIRVRIFIV